MEIENPMVIDRLWKSQHNRQVMDEDLYEEIEMLACESCGAEWDQEDLDDQVVASEIWEDTWICKNDPKCMMKHYIGWCEPVTDRKYYQMK